MYNLLFALFLFGMLITHSIRIFRRAVYEEIPGTPQEYALLFALAIGCMIALQMGARSVYGTNLIFF